MKDNESDWNKLSNEKRSCDYWIHNKIECCQTMDNVNYCPPCFELLAYMSNDDTIRPVNNVVPRTVNTDDDVISEFNTKMNSDDIDAHTVMSDSCETIRNTLNKINESNNSRDDDNGKPPQSIEVENATMFTDVCDNNLTVGNEKILTIMLWNLF